MAVPDWVNKGFMLLIRETLRAALLGTVVAAILILVGIKEDPAAAEKRLVDDVRKTMVGVVQKDIEPELDRLYTDITGKPRPRVLRHDRGW